MSRRPPLFAYGTLQFPVILERLISRTPEMVPAVMTGGIARRLPGVSFPGLILDGDGEVSGVLLTDLSAPEWKILEDYEDDFYDLEPITVVTEHGEVISALAFVVDVELTTDELWTIEWFTEFHLVEFTASLEY